MKAQTVKEWLEKNVVKAGANECWNAAGGGYNKRGWHVAFKANGVRHLAHRAAWEDANGPIQGGLHVLHRCDNPKCCNPEHLFLGAQSDNAKDMWAKGRARQGSIAGKKLGPSKARWMTKEAALSVFELYKSGMTQKQIADLIGTTDVSISNLLKGKTYAEMSSERASIAHLLGRGVKKRLNAKPRECYRRMTFAEAA